MISKNSPIFSGFNFSLIFAEWFDTGVFSKFVFINIAFLALEALKSKKESVR